MNFKQFFTCSLTCPPVCACFMVPHCLSICKNCSSYLCWLVLWCLCLNRIQILYIYTSHTYIFSCTSHSQLYLVKSPSWEWVVQHLPCSLNSYWDDWQLKVQIWVLSTQQVSSPSTFLGTRYVLATLFFPEWHTFYAFATFAYFLQKNVYMLYMYTCICLYFICTHTHI